MEPLFLTALEIQTRLASVLTRQHETLWQAWTHHKSFPKPVEGTNLYYVPAVLRWLEIAYGLPPTVAANNNIMAGRGENWDALKTRKTKRPADAGPHLAPSTAGGVDRVVAANDDSPQRQSRLPKCNAPMGKSSGPHA